MTNTSQQSKIEFLPLNKLHFDPQNPRFARLFGSHEQPEADIIERMVKNENVQELMGSIGEQGYFAGEPLLVAKNTAIDGYIVVEGNRRLAAVKLLRDELGGNQLPSIVRLREVAKITPEPDIPCIVFEDRREILRYLGFRHISGAKRWDSLSKARYLEQLRSTFFAEQLPEEQLKGIALEIGSKPHYVAQMLTGLTVFDHARQNDFYGLQRVREEDIEFSVLTTALSHTNIAEYIGLNNPRDISAKGLNQDRAKELFSWVFAQDEQGSTILGESRNLRKLAAVVSDPTAILTLKETGNLDTAFLFSDGPVEAFNKILREADKKLRDVFKLTTDIADFTEEHLSQLEKLTDLTEDIQSRVRRSIRKRKDGLHD